ncbi:MAG: DNA photolyase [Spirochaetes bacterium]|nr:DNA photolyase [Spirochaetota bacterium]
MIRRVRYLFVEDVPDVLASPVVKRFRRAFPRAKVHIVKDREAIDAILPPSDLRAKQAVFLCRNQGAFIRHCPGTKYFVCCGYRVIDAGFQCPFSCDYCFLHVYDNTKLTVVYTNTQVIIDEAAALDDRFCRIGTGELIDSLAYDDITGLSEALITMAADHPNMFLEFKTKSANIDHILARDVPEHSRRIVFAFSLNPQTHIERHEHGTASLVERLAAAKRCARAGYSVAFHFDPIIRFPQWQRSYRAVVNAIYRSVTPADIAWISMGGVRFPRAMEECRFASGKGYEFLFDEFVPCEDGKRRYLRPLREALYREMISAIRAHDRKTYLYMCMETPAMWSSVFDRKFSFADFEASLRKKGMLHS